MRKFLVLLAVSLLLPAMAAAEGDRSAVEALKAFHAPMEQVVREAAKGRDADLEAIAKAFPAAKEAWLKFTAEKLDLAQYGVPAAEQEAVWRQLRTAGLMFGYLDEGVQKRDRILIVRSAAALAPAYAKVAAALGAR